MLFILPFSKTPSASRTETVRLAAILTNSAFTVTWGGLRSRRSTPMVTFPPGLTIPGAVTRNLGLKSSQEEKNTVSYLYISILFQCSNSTDSEIDFILRQLQLFQLFQHGPTAPFNNCTETLLKQEFP